MCHSILTYKGHSFNTNTNSYTSSRRTHHSPFCYQFGDDLHIRQSVRTGLRWQERGGEEDTGCLGERGHWQYRHTHCAWNNTHVLGINELYNRDALSAKKLTRWLTLSNIPQFQLFLHLRVMKQICLNQDLGRKPLKSAKKLKILTPVYSTFN